MAPTTKPGKYGYLATFLREMRYVRGYNQREAAFNSNISYIYFNIIEGGRYIPSDRLIESIAWGLDIKPNILKILAKKDRNPEYNFPKPRIKTVEELVELVESRDLSDLGLKRFLHACESFAEMVKYHQERENNETRCNV